MTNFVRNKTWTMTISIQLQYLTQLGESMQLRVGKRRIPMESSFGGLWQILLSGRDIQDGDTYTFEVLRDGKVVKREWRGHHYKSPSHGKNIIVRSSWNDRPSNSAFYSSAFCDVIFRRPGGASFLHPHPEAGARGNVSIQVVAPEVRSHQSLALVGCGDKLGNWDRVHLMSDHIFPWWFITMDVQEPIEYKFVIVDTETLEIVLWEEGPNHFFAEVPPKDTQVVIADLHPRFATEPWRGAGVAVPVFSLRSEESFGCGEFNDIRHLVDWAEKTGQSIIQLLPINDTTLTHTWMDSYPYNAVSSFALHPQYVHLPAAGVREDAAYRLKKAELEDLQAIDYEAVTAIKVKYLRELYESPKGAETMKSAAYKAFAEANRDWLLPYATFCVLRDMNGTPQFDQWGEYADWDPRKSATVAAEYPAKVGFHCFVQYLLDTQLKEAVAYAHEHGVALKGDLPIGVSRYSVDTWQHPELFHLDSQAGAPPDPFAEDGQNWGFPTYDWDRMAVDGYAWWRARMKKMAEYFDAFRIDHILGFFRIWEIPAEYKSGLMGHFSPALPYSEAGLRSQGFEPGAGKGTDVLFVKDPREEGSWHPRIDGNKTQQYAALPPELKQRYDTLSEEFFWHRHDDFWKENALRKLPALLRSTNMLACGEDLGMIPACVPSVMEELNILGLEIQRMPKEAKVAFGHPGRYPYWCVCATGTHDTSPLRAWWEEDRALTQRYYNEVLGCEGDAPYFCEPWVAELIIGQHMSSPAMLAILPLQDWLALDGEVRYPGDPADERINIPAVPRHYWRYRMHCTLESLVADDKLNARLRSLVEAASRNH